MKGKGREGKGRERWGKGEGGGRERGTYGGEDGVYVRYEEVARDSECDTCEYPAHERDGNHTKDLTTKKTRNPSASLNLTQPQNAPKQESTQTSHTPTPPTPPQAPTPPYPPLPPQRPNTSTPPKATPARPSHTHTPIPPRYSTARNRSRLLGRRGTRRWRKRGRR